MIAQGSKFQTLDAFRMVAALSVVVYHFRLWFPDIRILDHAYLAVDFFFVLSGFVVAHAYEHDLRRSLKIRQLLAIRAIRLYPLLILGSCLGLAYQLSRTAMLPNAEFDKSLLWWFLLGALGIPIVEGAGSARQFFPLNWPAWSLFFEIVVNAIFVVAIRSLTTPRLVALTLTSGAALALAASHLGQITVTRDSMFFLAGIPRAMFPFFLGVLIFRLRSEGRTPEFRLPPLVWCAILFATFLPPAVRGSWTVAYDLFCVAFIYPALVLFGIQTEPSPRHGGPVRFGGELSYALYILHFPLFNFFVLLARNAGVPVGYSASWFAAAALVFVLGGVWLAGKGFDEPLRRSLMRRFGLRQSADRAPGASPRCSS